MLRFLLLVAFVAATANAWSIPFRGINFVVYPKTLKELQELNKTFKKDSAYKVKQVAVHDNIKLVVDVGSSLTNTLKNYLDSHKIPYESSSRFARDTGYVDKKYYEFEVVFANSQEATKFLTIYLLENGIKFDTADFTSDKIVFKFWARGYLVESLKKFLDETAETYTVNSADE